MFSQVHFQLKSIKRHTLHFTGIEAILIHNIVSYLSNRMCQMTEMFQKQQGDYMKSSYSKYTVDLLKNILDQNNLL